MKKSFEEVKAFYDKLGLAYNFLSKSDMECYRYEWDEYLDEADWTEEEFLNELEFIMCDPSDTVH